MLSFLRTPGLLVRLLLPVLLASCGTGGQQINGQQINDRGTLHALMTSEVNLQMTSLNALAFELHQTQTELDQLRRRRSISLAQAAGRLRQAAQAIPAASRPANLDTADDARFLELATALGGHAARLEQSAIDGRVELLEQQMQAINTTCNTCHALFR